MSESESEGCIHAMHSDCGMRAPKTEPEPEPTPEPEPPARRAFPALPRRFMLVRAVDDSGVSGTGVVADGVQFCDGKCVVRWLVGDHRSTVVWDHGVEDVVAIHGHGGHTRILWIDS